MQLRVVFFVAFCALCCLARGNTIHVPGDYPSIQAALVNAGTNDTVLVAPGTYYEHITWPNTQGIKLLSEYGPDTTFIDAAGALRCITMNVSMDSTTVINGFTICNGNMADGAGISCSGASPSIINNIISNNSNGSGIWIDSGDPIITNNIIIHNTGYDGGGIYCRMFGSPRIVNNLIEYNSAISMYSTGGGICTIDAIPVIERNIISHNTAETGGGIYTFKTISTIKYNTITHNAAQYGAGIRFYQSNAIVNYNDIFDNGYGVSSGFLSGQINVENNWWGDASGPYHATNPGGLGDTVSDYLDFTPWLTKPHGIEEQSAEPPFLVYLEVSPNPFTHFADIRYGIRDTGYIEHKMRNSNFEMRKHTMKIYDATGRLVKSFRTAPYALRTTLSWSGVDDANRKLGSGVYFLKLEAGSQQIVKKLVLIE